MLCKACGRDQPASNRFCTHCGNPLAPSPLTPAAGPDAEEMNMPVLYLMVGLLILAGLFPPWEAAPGQPPEFLGFYFILSPPDDVGGSGHTGVISRLLITIELVTIAVAGFYFSWLFRKKR